MADLFSIGFDTPARLWRKHERPNLEQKVIEGIRRFRFRDRRTGKSLPRRDIKCSRKLSLR